MKTSKSEYVKVPEYIPAKTYDQILDNFMKLLYEMDEIYKTSRLRYLEQEMIILIIRAVVNSYHDQGLIGKNLRRQITTYELAKYLKHLPKSEIGKLAGSESNEKRNCRTFVYKNCKKIQDYIDTRDSRCYSEIMDIDEKIKNILE